MKGKKTKIILMLLGDILVFYFALILTLILRYGSGKVFVLNDPLIVHLKVFSFLLLFWIAIFYIADLYSLKSIRLDFGNLKVFSLAIVINFFIGILIFYLFESFLIITPKTNMLMFTIFFAAIDYTLRSFLAKIFISKGFKKSVVFIGKSSEINEVVNYLLAHPQLGYQVIALLNEVDEKEISKLKDLIEKKECQLIVVEKGIEKNNKLFDLIYQFLPKGIEAISLVDFYELIFLKIPLAQIENDWFIKEVNLEKKYYETIKRIVDFVLSLILLIIFLPIMVLISLIIKLNSKGPAIFKDERIGKDGKIYVHYKFRIMKTDISGPLYTAKNDPRLTPVGKILRYSHLDELPQLFNILKGDLSFIGPRPERKALAQNYKKLPFYEMRHLIKPGLTGWAQINFKPSTSLEEAYEKLQYDLYYLKNRSFLLDFLILLKTIKYFFYHF